MPSTRPPVDYIERTRAQYDALGYPPYQWVENSAPPPWTALTKPLSQCRVGLIGSGGIYKAGQVAFHYKDDTSFRIIDTREPTSTLRATHFAYDLTDARSDPNVVFPIDTLNELAARRLHRLVGGARVCVHGRHLFVAPRARTAWHRNSLTASFATKWMSFCWCLSDPCVISPSD